jgi:hypothetical protein
MKPEKKQRLLEETARHEAGHALVCVLLKRPITRWRVGRLLDDESEQAHDTAIRHLKLPDEGMIEYEVHPKPSVSRQQEVLIMLAGPAAQGIAKLFTKPYPASLRIHPDTEDDVHDVTQQLDHWAAKEDEKLDDPTLRAVLEECYGRMRNVFDDTRFRLSVDAISAYMLERLEERKGNIRRRMKHCLRDIGFWKPVRVSMREKLESVDPKGILEHVLSRGQQG